MSKPARVKPVDYRRLRFSVPVEDVSVLEWIAYQANMSASIRALIKDEIRRNGITDATCGAVEQKKPVGRPKKAQEEPEFIETQETVSESEKSVYEPQSEPEEPVQIQEEPEQLGENGAIGGELPDMASLMRRN